METFIFDPWIQPPVLAALWTAAVAMCLLYTFWRPTRLPLKQRLALAGLHFLPMAAVLIMLHRPTWVAITGSNGGKPVLQVLVDSSGSMSAEDTDGARTRFVTAVSGVTENLERWNHDFDVRLATFDQKVTPMADGAALKAAGSTGPETDIAGAIEAALRQQPKASLMLLISDGIHNAPESDPISAAREARAAGVPIFTHCVGSNVTVRDLGVKLSSSEELAFVRQRARIPVTITQMGFDNSEVEVELRFEDKVLQTKKVRFEGSAKEAETEFSISQETPGLYSYEVAIPARPGEALISNNRRRFALRVVSDRIRVLLLEGKPYWDSKFLTRVLNADPNVLLTTATRMRQNKVVIEPPSLLADADDKNDKKKGPVTDAAKLPEWIEPRDSTHPLEDKRFLRQFQVLILGRDTDVFLSENAVTALRDWVSRAGGHLICVRGRPAGDAALTPALSAILPVAWKADTEKKFRMKLTERGRQLALFDAAAIAQGKGTADDADVLLKSLPSLVTATTIDKERALSVVLARGTDGTGTEPMAVLSVQSYGAGKTIVLEGQGMWRWGFRPPNDAAHGEDVFHAFWANTIRWLAGSNEFLPSQEMALRAGKPIYQTGERPILYVLKRDRGADAQSKDANNILPKIELVREDSTGAVDAKFPARELSAEPISGETAMFKSELEALDEGLYRARLVGAPVSMIAPTALPTSQKADVIFEVLAPLREKLDLRARPATLEQLSLSTDARALTRSEFATMGETFRDYIHQHKPGAEVKRPAWDHAWILGALMLWYAGTWWLRRRWGAI